jgi:membrane protein YqaA with SNARE-associated domain
MWIPVYFMPAMSLAQRVRELGGPGLILLGIADNSLIPMPGSVDVFTIWLAAHDRRHWYYYAAMATAGAVLGGYITYRLAQKGGKDALEKRVGKRKIQKVYRRFERWGFWAVAVPALLPPPFPIVPFLLAAGALQYSRKKFLGALALGRGARFTILAVLGTIYGTHIVRFFSKYYKPALITLIALSVIGGILALLEYLRYRRASNPQKKASLEHPARLR